MIWIKRIVVLLVGALFCISAFVVGVLVFFDDADYTHAAVWVVDTFLDSDLHIDGELTLRLGETLELNVGDVRLDARDDSYHFSSKTLKTAIQLWPLLSGTVWINELQVSQLFLKVNETTTQSSGSFDPRLLPVVIASANFQGLVFEYQETPPGTLHHYSLNELRLDDIAGKGPISIQGDGLFEGETFRLRGTLPLIEEVLDHDRPKPVELVVTGKNGHAKIAGTITDIMSGKGLDLHLDVATPATRLFLEWLGDGIPELGELRVNAQLRGDYDAPRLENINANLHRGKEVDLNVRGSVENIYSGADMLLHIDGRSTQPDVASWMLFGKLEQLDSLEFKGVLKEKDGHFYLSDVDAAASTRKGLSVKVHGNTELYRGEQLFLRTDSGVNAAFSAPTTAALNLFDTADVPEFGAVSGSAKLLISTDSIGLHDADVRIGGKGDSTARLQGQISDIPLHENTVATGIDMQLSVRSPDVAALAGKLNYSLAAIGPGEASMKVSGDLDNLKLKDVNIHTGNKDGLQITAKGNINRFVLGKSVTLDNALFDVAASTNDLRKLSELTGFELPGSGPAAMTSTLTLSKSDLVLNDLKVNVGRPDQPTIRLQGKITTQLHKGSTIHVDYGVSVADLVAAYTDKPPGYLGRLEGVADISDINGRWGIEKYKLVSSQTSIYQVNIHGGFDDLKNSDRVTVNVNFEVKQPAALGDALGINLSGLSPHRHQGLYTSNNDVIFYKGTLSMGKTFGSHVIHGYTQGSKPVFRGNFNIPVLDLTDLGFQLEHEVENEIFAKPRATGKDYLFSRESLDVGFLNNFDLDLKIAIDEVESYGEITLDSVRGHATLKDGEFRLDPFRFVYAGGTMDVSLGVQATEPPAYALKLVADDLKLGPAMAQVRNDAAIKGNTNILLDITASGDSAHELASNLNGTINVEYENARVPAVIMNLLAVDLFNWVFVSNAARQQYYKLNCVIAEFTADEGELKSKLLLADGPNMSLGGRIDLNLREETIDAVLLPKQKSRLFSSISPVQFSGPIKDPKVVAIPAQAAIKEIGMLAVSPTIYLPTRVLQSIWSAIKRDKDVGKGCTNITQLTDKAEKKKKSDQARQKPDPDESWWTD